MKEELRTLVVESVDGLEDDFLQYVRTECQTTATLVAMFDLEQDKADAIAKEAWQWDGFPVKTANGYTVTTYQTE